MSQSGAESAPPTGNDRPSLAEVMRVRRYECSMRGHSWRVIEVVGSEVPTGISCNNCGFYCDVVAAKHACSQGVSGA